MKLYRMYNLVTFGAILAIFTCAGSARAVGSTAGTQSARDSRDRSTTYGPTPATTSSPAPERRETDQTERSDPSSELNPDNTGTSSPVPEDTGSEINPATDEVAYDPPTFEGTKTLNDNEGMYTIWDPRFYGIKIGSDEWINTGDERLLSGPHIKCMAADANADDKRECKVEESIVDLCRRLMNRATEKNETLSHLSDAERDEAWTSFHKRARQTKACCEKSDAMFRASCFRLLQTDYYTRVCEDKEALTFGPITTKRPQLIKQKCCNHSVRPICFPQYNMKQEDELIDSDRYTVDRVPLPRLNLDVLREEIRSCCDAGRTFFNSLDADVSREECDEAAGGYVDVTKPEYQRCETMFKQCCRTAHLHRTLKGFSLGSGAKSEL